jgi:NAD+ synthase (glutamine-hydrolysing)
MRTITVATASVNQTPLAWDRNLRSITDAIAEARTEGAQILCFPELCITGYGSEDLFLSRWYTATAWSVLQQVCPLTHGMVVGLGLPLIVRNSLYNGYAICIDGKLVAVVAKQFLAGDGVHYEHRWFKPWQAGTVTELDEDYVPEPFVGVPAGDLSVVVDGVRIAVEICEDYWVPNRPLRTAALSGVDIVMSPSASHFAIGKGAERRSILREGARFSGAVVIFSNLLGCESGKIIFDGDSHIVTAEGVFAETTPFSLKRYEVAVARVDLERGRTSQQGNASLQPKVTPHIAEIVVRGVWAGNDARAAIPSSPVARRSSTFHPLEDLWRAITVGLLDYAEKSSSRGFVVSLSGGADSASVACLVSLMVARALREIGLSELVRRLRLASVTTEDTVMDHVLSCVYQKTDNSSQQTEDAARELAASLSCAFAVFEVQPLVDTYRSLAEKYIGRQLSWETDDTALQNVQARVRAPSVWMLANIQGALLLTTGNRSELSVGYATMDGDMCGGLNPIGGIDKPLLLEFLRWLAEEGPEGYGPIVGLEKILASPPTAELRPLVAAQTDEDDLMPYRILQAIEAEFVLKRRSPDDIITILEATHPGAPVRVWVERYMTLFQRNQWKRERAAPSFHLDRYSLDPRSWLRFPILSGE